MPTYQAPLDDIGFILRDVLDVAQLAAFPGYGDATPDVVLGVLEEAARLCEEVLAPLNQSGDQEGCHFENGTVRTPAGFAAAYEAYRAGGWPAMTADPAYGGQGLPHLVRFVFDEMLCAANLSFSMYPELAHGATMLLEQWGDDELKRRYLPPLVDGTWGGTMCLTEPQAGTDLGLLRTRAIPAGDGSYRVTGTKIFISAGDHDLTENIVHLVLARLPDAPPATRGITLFLVPKRLPTDTGAPGVANGVTVGSIEHKMGIRANATCVLDFDGATGWLVGEPHHGVRAMFTMMNGARLGVGMQGLGLASVAYQNAVAYARERLQGRAPGVSRAPASAADPIVLHPDVRRMLVTMKAYVEGMRALAYWVAMQIDVEARHPDAAQREEAADLVALMIPVIKAFLTDVGFEVTNLALQCYGGHGYIREYGMEQFVRDARIAQIYEGTNGVQAMDLIARKVGEDAGRRPGRFLRLVDADLARARAVPALAGMTSALADAVATLHRTTTDVLGRAARDPAEGGAVAVEYLRMWGLVATGWMWLRMALVAAAPDGASFAGGVPAGKLATAGFYFAKLLPQVHALAAQVAAGAAPVMAIAPDAL